MSSVSNTTTSSINSPSFDERRVRSRVAVNDGETVAIAGLIRSQATAETRRHPRLAGFRCSAGFGGGDKSDRTELLVLITPHIVADQGDARALTEALRGRLGPFFHGPLPG